MNFLNKNLLIGIVVGVVLVLGVQWVLARNSSVSLSNSKAAFSEDGSDYAVDGDSGNELARGLSLSTVCSLSDAHSSDLPKSYAKTQTLIDLGKELCGNENPLAMDAQFYCKEGDVSVRIFDKYVLKKVTIPPAGCW
jgi:hypothetical protein